MTRLAITYPRLSYWEAARGGVLAAEGRAEDNGKVVDARGVREDLRSVMSRCSSGMYFETGASRSMRPSCASITTIAAV